MPKFWEPSFWEVTDSFVFLEYRSLGASRNLLQQLLACLNFTLDSEDLFCWYKRKKWFLWTMAAAQAAENHDDEWGLTWYLRWGISTSITTLTYSQNSVVADALSLKISPMEYLSNDREHCPDSHKNSHKPCNETGHSALSLTDSQWKQG